MGEEAHLGWSLCGRKGEHQHEETRPQHLCETAICVMCFLAVVGAPSEMIAEEDYRVFEYN